MRVQVCSDLHLERSGFFMPNTQGADVLVLSGDILGAKWLENRQPGGITESEMFKRFDRFIRNVAQDYGAVVYVSGNHEFYGYKWRKTHRTIEEYLQHIGNVFYLERDFVWIGDTKFIGGTMWTDMNGYDPLTLHAVRDMMNDYTHIVNDDLGYTKLKPDTTAMYHAATIKDFEQFLKGASKAVVCTHHAPTFKSVPPYYADQHIMNGAYASDLSEFILDHPQIKLWTHGHMHDPCDYMVGDTRVVCNPRGYVGYETIANGFTGYEMIVEI